MPQKKIRKGISMLSVIIQDNGEPNVISLTYQNLWRELKDISGSELLVGNWIEKLGEVKNNYVCFVEADCLVNSGYFSSQMGLFKKNNMFRKLAMLSSATAVNDWHNRFYGYRLGESYVDGVIPDLSKRSTAIYPVQIGYVPGSIIRLSMLKNAMKALDLGNQVQTDLVKLSTELSLWFWKQGDGNRVHLNPNTTYVSTEGYINDIGKFDPKPGDLVIKFKKEAIQI